MQNIKVSLHKNSDQLHGFINNQQNTWSFKMDKVAISKFFTFIEFLLLLLEGNQISYRYYNRDLAWLYSGFL